MWRRPKLLEKRFGADASAGAQNLRRRRAAEPLVLVLDELDYLVTRKQSVIYNLFEWATNGTSALIVVAISNTMDLPERLLPRVHSRLGIRRVNFHPLRAAWPESPSWWRHTGHLATLGSSGCVWEAWACPPHQ